MLLLFAIPLVWGLSPHYTHPETVDRYVNGFSLRSYIVVFDQEALSFESDSSKLTGWLETLGEHFELNHIYDIAWDFRGFSIWANEAMIQKIREHTWIKYVEDDTIARLSEISVKSGASFITRPDWGQVRVAQRSRNLATTPAGLYDGATYPDGGADTTTWNWAANVTNGYHLINNGKGAKVWIVDTGILFDHQEFVVDGASRITTRENFADGNPTNGDCNGHGTHAAGSAAGQYRGLATGAEIGSVRVLDCNGLGTTSNIIAGFNFIAANQALNKTNIMSVAFGSGPSVSMDNALNSIVDQGVVAVVASGNANANACNYSPAGASGAITVASSTKDDLSAPNANYGTCIAVFSPGQSIHSAYIPVTTSYGTFSGLGTPLVVGAIALYATTQPNPLKTAAVKQAIHNYATKNVIGGTLPPGTPNLLINANWDSQ